MIFYWFILMLRGLRWFFVPPSLAAIARVDENAPCPVCGERKGKIRTVLKQKQGPTNPNVPKDVMIVCQHFCRKCGARWFDPPIQRKATPGTVLPSVARDPLEEQEDRQAKLFEQDENT